MDLPTAATVLSCFIFVLVAAWWSEQLTALVAMILLVIFAWFLTAS